MNDQELYAHARDNRIPGGVQLRSKLPEGHAPGQWPAYFSRAQGIDVWDVDGRQFRDWASHGIGAALLGYAIFAELPDLWTWVGAAIIVASGIYVARREAALKRQSAARST